MTPQETYKRVLVKVNKNDTNGNVKVSKGLFVLIFNEQRRKWQEATLRKDEDSDYIEGVEELFVSDVRLTKIAEHTHKDDFRLPSDFYRKVTSYSLASKGDCKNQVLYNWFIKPKDRNILLQNSDQNPSFEYRETLALVNRGRISVFKDDFSVDKVFLSYYREPNDIDISGYTHIDGTPSTDVETTLSDPNMDYIIDRTATEIVRNYESLAQLQIALQREQENK